MARGARWGRRGLAKINPNTASADAANWQAASGGTPGTANFPAGPVLGPATTQVALNSPWWYNESGTDLGTAWRQTGYSPSAAGWQQGDGLFYDTPDTLPGPENTPGLRPQHLLLPHPGFSFTGVPSSTQLTLNCVIDDDAVFYLNGVEIQRVNMPTGTITYQTSPR